MSTNARVAGETGASRRAMKANVSHSGSANVALCQVALDAGASVTAMLGWRYALAAVVLAVVARQRLRAYPGGSPRSRSRSVSCSTRPMPRSSGLRSIARHRRSRRCSTMRTCRWWSAPQRCSGAIASTRDASPRSSVCWSASSSWAAAERGSGRDRARARLGRRIRRLHPRLRSRAPRRRSDGIHRAAHRRSGDDVPGPRRGERRALLDRRGDRPGEHRHRCPRRQRLRRHRVPHRDPAARPGAGVAPRHRRGADRPRARPRSRSGSTSRPASRSGRRP